MKVLCCKTCTDGVWLAREWRNCGCGATGGAYMPDGDSVIVSGPSFIIAFQNGLRSREIRSGQAWIYDEHGNVKVRRMTHNPGRFPGRSTGRDG